MAELTIPVELSLQMLKECRRDTEHCTKRSCEPCLYDNTEKEVYAFCTVCAEFLCRDCTREHKKNKVTRNHCVLEGEAVPVNSNAFKMMKKITSCSKHDVVVSYRCEDHDSFICITCLATEHRKCENISEICATEDRDVNDSIVLKLQQKRQELRQQTNALKSFKEKNIKSLQDELKAISKNRKNFVDSIIEQLQKLCEQSEIETVQLVSKELTALKQNLTELNKAEEERKIENDLLDTTIRYGNTTETSVVCAVLLKKMITVEKEYKERSSFKHVHLQVEQNENLKHIASLGEIKTVSIDANEALLLSNKEQLENTSDEVPGDEVSCVTSEQNVYELERADKGGFQNNSKRGVSLMQQQVSKDTSYSVRTETDKETCSVVGSASLPNNQIAIIDRSNRKIKVYNSNFSLTGEFILNATPIDICTLQQTSVALVFKEKKYIETYSIAVNAVSYERTQLRSLYGISIAHYRGWEVFVLCSDGCTRLVEIQIRNLWDGVGKRTISMTDVFEWDHFSTDSYRIHYADENKLYITQNEKIRCFEIVLKFPNTPELSEKRYYKSNKNVLAGSSDVTTDSEGNIYVSGKSSGNVHQVSGKNVWRNRLVVSKITAPTTAIVNSRRHELIVGCENDDCIHVYKFIE